MDGGRVVSKAVVIAYGVHESGAGRSSASTFGEGETEAFWREFLKSLLARGLTGV
jgi:putative transposase